MPSDQGPAEMQPLANSTKAELMHIAGGPIATKLVLFSDDARHFFTISGNTVRMFSVETSYQLRTFRTSTEDVTSIALNPANTKQLYTSSSDGHVFLWDYNDAILLKKISFGIPVRKILFLADHSKLYWISSRRDIKEEIGKNGASKKDSKKSKTKKNHSAAEEYGIHVYDLSLQSGRKATRGAIASARSPLYTTSAKKHWTADPRGNYLVGVHGVSLVIYWPESGKSIVHRSGSKISSIACHPTKELVATGDERGRIVMWHELANQTPITSTMHWHSHRVGDLTFNSDGSYLLSGGEEAVLVIWQLATGHKRFFPRLGAPLAGVSISRDNANYAAYFADNSVKVIDALSLKVRCTIRGLAQANTSRVPSLPCGLQIEPRIGLMVVNGSPGTLQFYDTKKDQVSFEQQIVDRVFISRTEDERVTEITVEKVAFTKEGKWMTTFEYRNDKQTTPDVRLKFWEYSSQFGRYVLNTSIEPAHGGLITSLSAHPKELLVVSTGQDNVFKGWIFQHGQHGSGNGGSWRCAYIRSYQDLPCHCSAISKDGSLLAVGAGHYVTLWNPKSCEPAAVLPTPGKEQVESVIFTSSAYLVTHGASFLTVWNLLNCRVWWRIQMDVAHICASLDISRFAVVTKRKSVWKSTNEREPEFLLEFEPNSTTPLYETSLPNSVSITAMSYVNSIGTSIKNKVMAVDKKMNVRILVDHDEFNHIDEAADTEKAQLVPLSGTQRQSNNVSKAYEQLFGANAVNREADNENGVQPTLYKVDGQTKDASGAVFSVPAHVLPPMDTLAGTFLDLILRKRQSNMTVDEEGMADVADDAEDMSDNEVVETVVEYDGSEPSVVDSTNAVPTEPTLKKQSPTRASEEDLKFLVDFFERGRVPVPLTNGLKRKKPDQSDEKAVEKKSKKKIREDKSPQSTTSNSANDKVVSLAIDQSKTPKVRKTRAKRDAST